MTRRFIIRDIETKKPYRINNRWADFRSISSAKDFLIWMPFGLGYYYEVFDDREQMVSYSFERLKSIKGRKRGRQSESKSKL